MDQRLSEWEPPLDFVKARTLGVQQVLPDGRRRLLTHVEIWRSKVVVRWVEQAPSDWSEVISSRRWMEGWSLHDDVGTMYSALGQGAGATPKKVEGAVAFRPLPPPGASLLTLSTPGAEDTDIVWSAGSDGARAGRAVPG